jgi:hypothetical protein
MRYIIFLSVASLLLVGCATQSVNLKKNWQPAAYLLKEVPPFRPTQDVRGENLGIFMSDAEFSKKLMSPSGGLSSAEKARVLKSNNTILGFWQICCPLLNPGDLREIVARLGGDYYEYTAVYAGKATGTQMVPVGYTTPQFATTTSQASGYGNYNGSYVNNYGGGGNVYGNAYANAYGSSQTMLSGSTTYAARQYQYEVATQGVTIFATPKRAAELVKLGVLPSKYVLGQTQNR